MGRPNRQEERKQTLIEAAQHAVVDRGLVELSLTDVAREAGLTRGAVLYYFDDLEALLVEAHRAGIQRFCDDRDQLLASVDAPGEQLGIAIDSGLPHSPDDGLLRLLYEFDVLAGHSELHDRLVQRMYLRQLSIYQRVIESGVAAGEFTPVIEVDDLAMTMVALEDSYGLHIVAGNVHIDVPMARRAMRAVAAGLGCPAVS